MKLITGLLAIALALTACSDSAGPASETAPAPQATSAEPVSTPIPTAAAPTPGPACCITTVTVSWPTDAALQTKVPDTWDFEASAPCGTIVNPSIQIASDTSGQADATVSSRDEYGCEMTVTWQNIPGWTVEGGNAQTSADSSANAGEFRSIDFVMSPAS